MTQDQHSDESLFPPPAPATTFVTRPSHGSTTTHTSDNPLPPDRRARRDIGETPTPPIDWGNTVRDTVKTVTTLALTYIPASAIGQGDLALTGVAAFILQPQLNFLYERLILQNHEASYSQLFLYNLRTALAAGAISAAADSITTTSGYLTAGQEIARNASHLWDTLLTSIRQFQLPTFHPPSTSSPPPPAIRPEIRPPSPPLVDFDHIRSQIQKEAASLASIPAIIVGGLALYALRDSRRSVPSETPPPNQPPQS